MLKVFALSTNYTVLYQIVPRRDEFLVNQIRKLEDNRLLAGGDFLEHSYVLLYWFSLFFFNFSATALDEMKACLTPWCVSFSLPPLFWLSSLIY